MRLVALALAVCLVCTMPPRPVEASSPPLLPASTAFAAGNGETPRVAGASEPVKAGGPPRRNEDRCREGPDTVAFGWLLIRYGVATLNYGVGLLLILFGGILVGMGWLLSVLAWPWC